MDAASLARLLPRVLDAEASELPILPPASSDFTLILLAWCMIAWSIRLAYMVITLREVRHAHKAGKLLCFEDVPFHSLVVPLDVDSRRRFLSFLRARVPDVPTAPSRAYSSPVAVRSVRIAGRRGGPEIELDVDCAVPATLQIFWGVDPAAVLPIVRMSDSANSPHHNRNSTAVAAHASSSGQDAAAVVSTTPPQPTPLARSLLSLRGRFGSARTQPVVRQFSAIEMDSVPAGNTGRRAVTPTDGPISPSHTLSEECFRHCSPPVAVSAGSQSRLTLSPSQTAAAPLAATTPGTTALLLFSQLASCPPAPTAAASAATALPPSLTAAPRTAALAYAVTLTFARDEVDESVSSTQAPSPAAPEPKPPEGALASAPASGGGGAGGRAEAALRGSVVQQLLLTPEGLMQLAEVFGLDEWEQESCVACLSEPRDTILLPCRHLCICSSCFSHLTLDRCPVCRATFSSYLRFDAATGVASR